jgi:tRNA(Ile)-lysidine synthase
MNHPVERALRATFGRGQTVVAAVSGGPDSMAMLHGLCEFARDPDDVRVIAAHFDHQLRADGHRDREPVEYVAAKYGAQVVFGTGDVAAHARASRQSIEAAARDLRYAFLERTADETGANVIATAHTRDDQIETVLMRIIRGAGSRGLRGIPGRRGRIVRPLLGVKRVETVGYCQTHGVPHVIDISNADRRFFRNRVRHDVLPSLRVVYWGVDAAIEKLAAEAHSEFAEAERATSLRLDTWLRAESSDVWILDLEALHDLSDDHRIHLLSNALDAIGGRDNVSRIHYRALLGLKTGGSIDLPGLRVRREHDAIVFTTAAHEASDEAHPLEVPGAVTIGAWTLASDRLNGVQARAEMRKRERESHVVYVAPGAPLTVRFPLTGDRMQPFGMSGHKKLSDLFIDMKIPRRIRVETPVIESSGEILWVVGVAASELTRIDEAGESVIRVTATRRDR